MQAIESSSAADSYGREDQLEVLRSFLAHDEEGNAYIDYLRVAFYESEDPQWVLKKHNDLINERLALFAKKKSIRSKYEWLRDYHDRTVRALRVRPERNARNNAATSPVPTRSHEAFSQPSGRWCSAGGRERL
jgi:hypothetical protein